MIAGAVGFWRCRPGPHLAGGWPRGVRANDPGQTVARRRRGQARGASVAKAKLRETWLQAQGGNESRPCKPRKSPAGGIWRPTTKQVQAAEHDSGRGGNGWWLQRIRNPASVLHCCRCRHQGRPVHPDVRLYAGKVKQSCPWCGRVSRWTCSTVHTPFPPSEHHITATLGSTS